MADDTYSVTRSVLIYASHERVYEQIVDFHNWAGWSPWESLDPAMRRTCSGADSGVGARYNWSGNRKAGEGSMAITEAVTPSLVRVDVVFEKPFKSSSESSFTIVPAGAGAEVTWTMTGRKTLATKVMGVFKSMDKMIGPDFDKGLAQLKSHAEEPIA